MNRKQKQSAARLAGMIGSMLAGSIMITALVFADTHYVNLANPTPVNPYTNWAIAATTIQHAVDVCVAGDEVIVTNGVYGSGTRVTPGYACSNRVVITKNITLRSVNGPADTMILGSGPLGDAAVRCVYMSTGMVAGFTLSNGFTISDDNVDSDWNYDKGGGGLNLYGGGGIVSNCVIRGNTASANGGGILGGKVIECMLTGNRANSGGGLGEGIGTACVINSNQANWYGGGAWNSTVSNCTINGNTSGDSGGGTAWCIIDRCMLNGNSTGGGGGMYNGRAANSVIKNNTAVFDGGGVASWVKINDCIISGNRAGGQGGGITFFCVISNCSVIGNSAAEGGGIYRCTVSKSAVSENAAVTGGGVSGGTVNNSMINGNTAHYGGGTSGGIFNNCTISGNAAIYDGGGTYGSEVRNTIVYQNGTSGGGANWSGGTFSYSCTVPMPAGGNNITNDPILASASHIAPQSPCIARGSAAYVSGSDFDGQPWNNPPSIGCDEVYPDALTGTLHVAIRAVDTTAVAGVALVFSADILGIPASNRWTLGDGGALDNGTVVRHAWIVPGVYPVILRAFNTDNPQGVAATVSVTIVALDTATFFVNLNNTAPAYPYTNWPDAATNIQDAVDAAECSGVIDAHVLVTNGVYATGERVTPGYASTNRVVITHNITVRSVNGSAVTIIQGFKGQSLSIEDSVRCAYISAGMLAGFTLSNGSATVAGHYEYDRSGGGANMYGGNGVVSNCVIIGNWGGRSGGGIAYGLVIDSCISGNGTIHYGGGTYYANVRRCSITNNSAFFGGGSFGGTLGNSIISRNTAIYFEGGGVYGGVVNNCLISGNTSDRYGGGTYSSTVNSSTISGNAAALGGGGTCDGTVTNSIVWGNRSSGNSSNMYNSAAVYTCSDPLPPGEGNIDTDPYFISTNDFHLQAGSPCINAGTNLPWMVGATDLDGNPRILPIPNGRVDMGAYEYIPEPADVVLLLAVGFARYVQLIRRRKSMV